MATAWISHHSLRDDELQIVQAASQGEVNRITDDLKLK
jgi:hypothetical protein